MSICFHAIELGRKNENHAVERENGMLTKRWKLRVNKKQAYRRITLQAEDVWCTDQRASKISSATVVVW